MKSREDKDPGTPYSEYKKKNSKKKDGRKTMWNPISKKIDIKIPNEKLSKKKVYCSKCEYWGKGYLIEYPNQNVYICNHKENLNYKKVPENYFESEHEEFTSYKSYPSVMNKNNDCKLYRQKEYRPYTI